MPLFCVQNPFIYLPGINDALYIFIRNLKPLHGASFALEIFTNIIFYFRIDELLIMDGDPDLYFSQLARYLSSQSSWGRLPALKEFTSRKSVRLF